MKHSLLILLIFLSYKGFSQGSTFTIDRTRTCVGSQVNVTLTTVAGDSNWGIDYDNKGDGNFNNPCNCFSTSHIYSLPGTYQVEMAFSPSTFYPPLTGPLIKVTVKDTTSITNSTLLSAFGCTGSKGRVITNDVSNTYDYYEINWGDGTSIQTISGTGFIDHTYTGINANNPKTVTGLGRILQGPGLTACGSNLPFSTVIYPLSVLGVAHIDKILVNNQQDGNNGSLTLTITPNPTMRHYIYQKTGLSGSYDTNPIDTIEFKSGAVNVSVGGLNTSTNRYCYKAVTFDACGTTPVESSEVCSTIISAAADATGNTVNWGSYPVTTSNVPYDLMLNGTVITTTSVKLPANTTITYLDQNVRCKEVYCYQVIAKLFGSANFQSISDTICVLGQKQSSIGPVSNFNSSFENGGMKLSWDPSTFPGVTYRMYKSGASGLDTTFLDTTGSASKTLGDKSGKCYGVKIKEQCGESPLKISCPIQLTGQKDNIVQNSLDWKGGYLNGDTIPVTDYTVEQYNENGNPLKSESQGGALSFIHNPIDTVNQKVLYRVKGTLANSSIVYSDYVSIIQDLRLYVPEAFTPNSDGLNDTFYAKGLFWDQFELAVYNRWGEVVFSSSEKSKNWDGGSFAPGLYHCVAKVKDKYGNSVSWKHSLTMIR